jgi:hypothetical protein
MTDQALLSDVSREAGFDLILDLVSEDEIMKDRQWLLCFEHERKFLPGVRLIRTASHTRSPLGVLRRR